MYFEQREKPETQRKTSQSKDETNNELNPHKMQSPGIKPVPHWWEVGALTTVPSLLPSPPLLFDWFEATCLV